MILAVQSLPHWGIAAIAVGVLLVILFAANLVGNALGFLLKYSVVLGALAVGLFFTAPYLLGKERGDSLQSRVESTLHLKSLTSCSKAFDHIGGTKTATKLSTCGGDAKQDTKQDANTQTHQLRVKIGK